MNDTLNISLVGVGGQGTLLASEILCQVALLSGKDVKKSEVHGMAQRGGSVVSQVRMGEKVHSPLIGIGETDVLIAFEKARGAQARPFPESDRRGDGQRSGDQAGHGLQRAGAMARGPRRQAQVHISQTRTDPGAGYRSELSATCASSTS